jgi:hypothetical protein
MGELSDRYSERFIIHRELSGGEESSCVYELYANSPRQKQLAWRGDRFPWIFMKQGWVVAFNQSCRWLGVFSIKALRWYCPPPLDPRPLKKRYNASCSWVLFLHPFNEFTHNFFDAHRDCASSRRAILPSSKSLFWSVEDDLATKSSFPFRPDLAHSIVPAQISGVNTYILWNS